MVYDIPYVPDTEVVDLILMSERSGTGFSFDGFNLRTPTKHVRTAKNVTVYRTPSKVEVDPNGT